MEKKNEKNNNKILILAIIITVLICIPVGIVVGSQIVNNKTEEKNKNSNQQISTGEQIEFANLLIQKFNLHEYISIFFGPNAKLNENLLDPYDGAIDYIYMYGDIRKISMEPSNLNSQPCVFAKYNDFNETYKNLFGKEYPISGYPSSSTNPSQFKEIVKFSGITTEFVSGHTRTYYDNWEVCDKSNLNECYVPLGFGGLGIELVEMTNLRIENNTLKGDIRQNHTYEENYHIDGSFEFKYIKQDNKYYIDSLIFTSKSDKIYN